MEFARSPPLPGDESIVPSIAHLVQL